MNFDRAEWTGTGAAVVFHVALIAALSMSLASVSNAPEPPSMEVELVEEVGLQSAAPQPYSPPPPSQAPEIGEAIEPTPAPRVEAPAPTPSIKPAPPRPQKAAPPKPAPRVSRLGDDFLKGIEGSDAPSRPAKPAAATFDNRAKANVGQLIIQQAQRCANRQAFIGEGADKIRLTVNLRFSRSGRLSRPPAILGSAGDPELRSKSGELLEDQVRRIFAECSPFRLPAELYDTPTGGWKDFTFHYRVD